MAALERIGAALDLDYCGIDFAVNAASDTLLFEANATVVLVVPLSADRKWDYRRPAFDKVFAAVHSMLVERAAGGGASEGGGDRLAVLGENHRLRGIAQNATGLPIF